MKIFVAFSILLLGCCLAWDTGELQMFDLVEEIKQNFYDFLGVSNSATSAEIKKAYRQLSAKLHPDKNVGDPNASEKFRQLVGVYEVLKNEDLRIKYDEVLKNGLPDWKMPLFYYRKLRKMSNYELFTLFFGLATVIHYAVLWGSVFEKRLTLEDQLSTSMKRHKARDRKLETIEQEISRRLSEIPGPGWKDILPFALCKGIYAFILFIPVLLKFFVSLASQKMEKHRQFKQELNEIKRNREKMKTDKEERKKRLKEQNFVKKIEQEAGLCTVDFILNDLPSVQSDAVCTPENNHLTSANQEWTEADLLSLVHAIARYPGGVSGRWERIAETLKRTVPEVVAKVKSLGEQELRKISQKDTFLEEIPVFETNMNAICGTSESDHTEDEADSSDDIYAHSRKNLRKRLKNSQISSDTDQNFGESSTNQENMNTDNMEESKTDPIVIDEPYISRKKLKQQKLTSQRKTNEVDERKTNDGWNQIEQKQLEVAIRSIPKGTLERWDRIADCIPTKTKGEIMMRVKYLSTIVKQK